MVVSYNNVQAMRYFLFGMPLKSSGIVESYRNMKGRCAGKIYLSGYHEQNSKHLT